MPCCILLQMPKTPPPSSKTVTLLKDLNIPEEAVSTNLIDQEHFPHPSIRWQAGAIELSFISRSEDDEHLALLGLPQPHDILLQVQVLGAIVSEHHNKGLGRRILKSNQQTLRHSLLTVPPTVVRFKHQVGGSAVKCHHIVCVKLELGIYIFI